MFLFPVNINKNVRYDTVYPGCVGIRVFKKGSKVKKNIRGEMGHPTCVLIQM